MDVTPPLPIEILVKIFTYISFDDLIQAGAVCKDWKTSSEDNHIWLEHYSRRIGADPQFVHENSPVNVFYKRKYVNYIQRLLGDNDFNLALQSTVVLANCYGQRIRGLIILKAKKRMLINGVFLRLFCEEKASYMKYEIVDHKYKFTNINQTPFDKTHVISAKDLANPNQEPLDLKKGVHCFKVDVPFPQYGQNGEYLSGTMLSESTTLSFMDGSIAYGAEAFIGNQDGSKKLHTSTVILKALPKYDIRDELHKANPIKSSSDSYVFFGAFHQYKLEVNCSVNTFILGQSISLSITVINSTSKPVKKILISMRKYSICPQSLMFKQAKSPLDFPTQEVMGWEIEFPVPPHETKTHEVDLRIPKDLDQSILYSRVMQVRHILMVQIASGPLVRFPIVLIGTPRITDVV